MFDTTREIIASGLLGVISLGTAGWLSIWLPRRRREKARRRGIKRFGH